jgi:hypothetical protein
MLKKSFFLKNGRVNGECWGNEKAGRVVIFSHGFGVRRDSRGMFDELAELLKDDCLVVQFDYVDINEDGSTTAYSFSEQAEKLREVIKYVGKRFNPKEVNIVAHSQGCIIAGLVSPSSLDKAVLIAGPRKGTKIKEKGISKIERSDGSITLVPPQYWREVSKVNPAELYLKLAKKSKVYFIRALQDQMVTGEDYSLLRENKDIDYLELQGNHDFEGKDRKSFLAKVTRILKQE